MPRRGSRRRLAPNIYEDGTGIAVVVKGQKEHRFPHGTPIGTLEATRDRLKNKARLAAPPRTGSLAADAAAYLKTISETRKLANAAGYCAHWTTAVDSQGVPFGEQSRFALTPLVIEQIVARWLRDGVAASSCKKRLSALSAIFDKVNGEDDPNPVSKVARPKEPEPEPRAIALDVVARILAAMPDRGHPRKGQKRPTVSRSKLALAFMAYTGIPPAQIARINPDTDIDWSATDDDGEPLPALRRRPRRKGKGTPTSWIGLEPPAADALQQLIAASGRTDAGTLQPLDTHAMDNAWRRACAHVIREQLEAGETPLPHRVVDGQLMTTTRPYDLRHSWLTHLAKVSGNLAGVQEHAQHATPRQTMRYIGAAIPVSARQVSKAVRKTLPAAGVPVHQAKAAGTTRQRR